MCVGGGGGGGGLRGADVWQRLGTVLPCLLLPNELISTESAGSELGYFQAINYLSFTTGTVEGSSVCSHRRRKRDGQRGKRADGQKDIWIDRQTNTRR